MFSLGSLPPLFAGLSWCVAFPLLYSWTYDSCWYLSKIRIDFLLGTGIFLLLTSLYALLCSYIRRPKLLAGIFALLDFLCLVVPFIQFIYYAIFQHCLTPPSLMALYLTNFHESINFIQFNIGASNAIAILAALAALNGLLWLGNLRAARQQQHPMTTKSRGILTALSLLLAVYVPFGLLPEAEQQMYFRRLGQWYAQQREYEEALDWLYRGRDFDGLLAAVQQLRDWLMRPQHRQHLFD